MDWRQRYDANSSVVGAVSLGHPGHPPIRQTDAGASLPASPVPQTPPCFTSSRPAVLLTWLPFMRRTETATEQPHRMTRLQRLSPWLLGQPKKGAEWEQAACRCIDSPLAASGTTGSSVGTSSVGATMYCKGV